MKPKHLLLSITSIFILSLRVDLYSQARIVFGTTADSYIVMSNTYTTIAQGATTPIYLVMGNTSTAAPASSITRAAAYGRIISNSENNIVKWFTGNNTGAYTIPWGFDNGASTYVPFTFNITSAGSAGGNVRFINFTTYRTGATNSAMFPAGVTSDWSSACACNASPWMVDRLWMIDNADYGGNGFTPTGDLTFYYVDGGSPNPEVLTTGNSLTAGDEANLQAESYNNNSGLWTGTLYGTDTPGSNKVDGTGAIPVSKLDKWWTLVEKNHPLPVTWLGLSSSCDKNDVIVSWSTASEQNADHFTVERSLDGNYFMPIGTVLASGSSSTIKNYSFRDTDVPAVTCYYRLSETDFNGQSDLSKQITQNKCGEDISISVFPSPAAGNSSFNLAVAGAPNEEIIIVVTDMLGREFYSSVVVLENEKEVIAIDPAHTLAAGVYMVTATSNDKIYNKKIVIK